MEISYRALLPEMITSGAGMMIMLAGRRAGLIALCGLLAAAASALSLRGRPGAAFSGMILVDEFRVFFALILLLAALLVVLISLKWIEEEEALPRGEYFALLMFAVTGMLLMSAAGDLVVIFLGLELSSIATYALCGSRRRDPRSNESAVKYFILGSFSTAFLLYGIALIYGASYDPAASPAATTNLQLLKDRFVQGRIFSEEMLFAGAAMMIVGFGFKLAAAPFHIWSPDVYEGAPTPVTALLSSASKVAAFSAFLRVSLAAFQATELDSASTNALAIMAALTMTVGNLIAIVQSNIKRMLAYSSIAHAGYALVGMVAGDWRSVAFYMLGYSVINIGAFAVVEVIARRGDQLTNISDYSGIGFRALGLASALSLFLLSLAGVPLTAGFMGKLLVFKSAWGAGFHGLVIIAVINSAISWYYYLRVIVVMFFSEPRSEFRAEAARPLAAALALMVLATFYLGIAPGRVLTALERISP